MIINTIAAIICSLVIIRTYFEFCPLGTIFPKLNPLYEGFYSVNCCLGKRVMICYVCIVLDEWLEDYNQ